MIRIKKMGIAFIIVASLPAISYAQWTDPVLVSNMTPIKAIHILELRTQINTKLVACGQPAQSWTHSTLIPNVSTIQKVDMDELRAATTNLVNVYRQVESLPPSPPIFTDPTLTAKTSVIKAQHVTELRAYVSGANCPACVPVFSTFMAAIPPWPACLPPWPAVTPMLPVISAADQSTVNTKLTGMVGLGVITAAQKTAILTALGWAGDPTWSCVAPDNENRTCSATIGSVSMQSKTYVDTTNLGVCPPGTFPADQSYLRVTLCP